MRKNSQFLRRLDAFFGRCIVCVMLFSLLGGACMRTQNTLQLPLEELRANREEVEVVGDDVRAALDEIEREMMDILADVPDVGFDASSLYAIRYALLSCFAAPTCEDDDTRSVCRERVGDARNVANTHFGLDGRPHVSGYLPCDLPPSKNLMQAADTWSPEALTWFRSRVQLVDVLRVRLKAQIPERLKELNEQVARYRTELQKMNKRAEDRWRDAQRVEKRLEQRRKEEQTWSKYRAEAVRFEESITLIELNLDRLQEHRRRDIRSIAVRLVTLGAPPF